MFSRETLRARPKDASWRTYGQIFARDSGGGGARCRWLARLSILPEHPCQAGIEGTSRRRSNPGFRCPECRRRRKQQAEIAATRQDIESQLKPLKVTSIMPGEPGIAIINKKEYAEGDKLALSGGKKQLPGRQGQRRRHFAGLQWVDVPARSAGGTGSRSLAEKVKFYARSFPFAPCKTDCQKRR